MDKPTTPEEFRRFVKKHVPEDAIVKKEEWIQPVAGYSYKCVRFFLFKHPKRYVFIDYWSGVITVRAEFGLDWGVELSASEASKYALALSYAADIVRALGKEETK